MATFFMKLIPFGDQFDTATLAEMDVEQQTELMYQEGTIWMAIFKSDQEAINQLIEENPKIIDERGAVGECPIHLFFLLGTEKHLSIAQDLLRRYPQIVTQTYNKSNYFGENILHLAIVKQNRAMVEWLLTEKHLQPYRKELLEAKATGDFFKIGKPGYYGETPLGFACSTKQWNIVEVLLEQGADVDITDSNGNNILHVLVIRDLPDIYAKYKARWIEKQTELTDADPKTKKLPLWNRVNKDNLTPLTLAADLGRVKMLLWLLEERKTIQWSYGDVSCVLHPLAQLDLDLEDNNKTKPLSVLEVILQKNNVELIHPIIISLIDKKWKHFAYRILQRRFVITFVYLLIFLATTMLEQTQWETTTDNEYIPDHLLVRRIACDIGHFIVIIGALWKGGREIDEIITLGLMNYFGTAGSVFLENCMACLFCLSILLSYILRLIAFEGKDIVLAFASLIGWAYMLFFMMPFHFTGPFVIMIYKMLFNDVLRFCIIYMIFLAGFSQSFFILFRNDGFFGYISSIKRCFLGLLGDFDLDYYLESPFPIASVTLLIFYVVLITILLLNLLIAMMGDTFADVKKSAKKLWHLERTRIALDIEQNMSMTERKLKKNKYWVEVKGERYLQVEQIDTSFFSKKDEDDDDDDK